MNEVEAQQLTGQPVRSVEDALAALQVLLSRGCDTVIITLGAVGSVFATKEAEGGEGRGGPVHVPTTPVTSVVDTTVCCCLCLSSVLGGAGSHIILFAILLIISSVLIKLMFYYHLVLLLVIISSLFRFITPSLCPSPPMAKNIYFSLFFFIK